MPFKKINSKLYIIAQTAYSLEEKDEMNNFDDCLITPIWSHYLLNTLSKYLS